MATHPKGIKIGRVAIQIIFIHDLTKQILIFRFLSNHNVHIRLPDYVYPFGNSRFHRHK
jgi:hypothetical protein